MQEIATNGLLKKNARRVLNFNDKIKKKSAGVQRVLRQRVDVRKVSQPMQEAIKTIIKKEVTKKKGAASPLVKQTPSVAPKVDDLHECEACQKQFKSHTSVLKHKYYCPNRSTPLTSPSPSLPSVHQKKSATQTSSTKRIKVEKPSENSVAKQTRSKDKSPEPKSSSSKQNAIPARLVDTPSVAKKKVIKPSKTIKVTTNEKVNKNKSKSAGSIITSKGKKAVKKIKPISSSEDESEEEEVTPARPVRSSRKSSNLNMEDQVEASFLEALSPEQRVRVSEQKCPFCNKHYVYRSNFKKHLVEGCDTVDVEDEKPSTSSQAASSTTSALSVTNKRSIGLAKRSADASPSPSRKEVPKKVLKMEILGSEIGSVNVAKKGKLNKSFDSSPVKPKSKKKTPEIPVLEYPSRKKKKKLELVPVEEEKATEVVIKKKKSDKKKSEKQKIKKPILVGTSKVVKLKATTKKAGQLLKMSKKKLVHNSKTIPRTNKNGKEAPRAEARKNNMKSASAAKKKEKQVTAESKIEPVKITNKVPESVIKEKQQECEKVPIALHQIVEEEEHLSADTAESLPGKSAMNPPSDIPNPEQSHPCAKQNGTEDFNEKSDSNFISGEDVVTNVSQSLSEMVSPVVRQVLNVMEEHPNADTAESVPESTTPEECSYHESTKLFTVGKEMETSVQASNEPLNEESNSIAPKINDSAESSQDEFSIQPLQAKPSVSQSPNEKVIS